MGAEGELASRRLPKESERLMQIVLKAVTRRKWMGDRVLRCSFLLLGECEGGRTAVQCPGGKDSSGAGTRVEDAGQALAARSFPGACPQALGGWKGSPDPPWREGRYRFWGDVTGEDGSRHKQLCWKDHRHGVCGHFAAMCAVRGKRYRDDAPRGDDWRSRSRDLLRTGHTGEVGAIRGETHYHPEKSRVCRVHEEECGADRKGLCLDLIGVCEVYEATAVLLQQYAGRAVCWRSCTLY